MGNWWHESLAKTTLTPSNLAQSDKPASVPKL